MNAILERTLNRITMYRLMLYYAAAMLAAALALGIFGYGPADPAALAFSLVLTLAVCWVANRVLAAVLRVPANVESVYITALLLILIMEPPAAGDLQSVAGLVLAAFAAIASKFLLAVGRKHIFNPVAFGALAAGLLLDQPPLWWAGGNMTLMPIVVLGGLLVLYKVQRFDMVAVYILANLGLTVATMPLDMAGTALQMALLYSPLLFAGFTMLTDPMTAAHGRRSRLLYGVIVGALSVPTLHIGEFYTSPELAFLVANLFAFAVGSRRRFRLTLVRIEEMASGCCDFVFRADRPLAFSAGQHLDWTLDVRNPDSRGNRRPFTIASAPSEELIRLGVKFPGSPSAFKQALHAMAPGGVIYGSQVAGSFVLPPSRDEKLAFIAGGIGVTPFRSMVQEMIIRQERRPVVMLYGNNTVEEVAYADVFDRATRELGLRIVHAIAKVDGDDGGLHRGHIDEALIRREIPDFRERTFYVSGPRPMVLNHRRVLRGMGVARSRIREDFFPGIA